MRGTLEEAGARWRLRFARELAHPPERVWRALTEPEHLRAWFPQHIRGEWRAGAALTFEHQEPGLGPAFGGEVLACEPPRLLEFRWGTEVLRFEIEPRGGGCTLTLLDTLAELGTAARDAAGWHACLDLLAADLDGAGPGPDAGARWAQVHPGYVEAFGPAASAVGPPPGNDPARAAGDAATAR